MSFILDALRKSEAERQRQDGPTLLEMRPSRPQRRLPLWVIGLAILLLVNIAVVLWFLLHTPTYQVTARVQMPQTATPRPAPPPAPVISAPPVQAPPVIANAAPRATAPPVIVSAPPPAPLPAPSSKSAENAPPAATASAPVKAAKPKLEPSDDSASLPDYATLSSSLPALRLDLHSYSPQPSQRYALINMHAVHEGDTLPEGPRVVQILPNGVVLSYQGNSFVLGRN